MKLLSCIYVIVFKPGPRTTQTDSPHAALDILVVDPERIMLDNTQPCENLAALQQPPPPPPIMRLILSKAHGCVRAVMCVNLRHQNQLENKRGLAASQEERPTFPMLYSNSGQVQHTSSSCYG